MGKLVFRVDDDLMEIIQHCCKGKCRIPYTDTISEEPGMWLVKDRGVYMMASCEGLSSKTDEKRALVVYANGHNPDKDKDTWQADREACGGDDFAEFIPIGGMEKKIKKGMKLVIELTPTQLSIKLLEKVELPKPRRQPKKRKQAEVELN